MELFIVVLVLLAGYHLVNGLIQAVLMVMTAWDIERELKRMPAQSVKLLPVLGLGFTRENLQRLQDSEMNPNSALRSIAYKYRDMAERFKFHMQWGCGASLGLIAIPTLLLVLFGGWFIFLFAIAVVMLLAHLVLSLINAAFLASQGKYVKQRVQESAPELYQRLQVYEAETPFGLSKEVIEVLRDPEAGLSSDMQWELDEYAAAVGRLKKNMKWGGGAFLFLMLPVLLYGVLVLLERY